MLRSIRSMSGLLLTPAFFTKEKAKELPFMPPEIWDMIYDIKVELEHKDKHKALTNNLHEEFMIQVKADDLGRSNEFADLLKWVEYDEDTQEVINLFP